MFKLFHYLRGAQRIKSRKTRRTALRLQGTGIMQKKISRSSFFCALIIALVSCSSSGPKTQYYSLFASKSQQTYAVDNKALSIGVGPIVLPEYIDHPGIVATTDSNRVIVSGYNTWAGDLKENMSRVLASNLSASLELDQVWAFPWDIRIKPNYKIRLAFEDFSGARGGEVNVVVVWTLLDKDGRTRLLVEKEKIVEVASSISYNDYVAALNDALNKLSEIIAIKVSTKINLQ